LFGSGYLGGQPKSGVEKGPTVLRAYKICEEIKRLGWEVIEKGDIPYANTWDENSDPPFNRIKNPRRVGEACEKLYNSILPVASTHFVLTLGGDHSLAMGSIAAVAKTWSGLSIVWVDAHGDINTDKTTDTGNLHGMPVAFLLGLVQGVPGFDWLKQYIDPKRFVYIGLRHVDFQEKRTISSLGIKAFSMHEVDKYGIGKVAEMALDHIDPKRRRPLHLSFDIDSMDPQYCPSTGTKVAGGLTYREANYICEVLAQTGRLVSMDITEFNPAIGTPEEVTQTAEVSIALARGALGLELTVDQIDENPTLNK
jgi:arginase